MKEIFEAIARSAVRIKEAINSEDLGYSQQQNQSGETQLKLDIKSDLIIEEELSKTGSVKRLASEEKNDAVDINETGSYLVGFDPLDGSSLVDVNLSVGSIFGIYEEDFSPKNIVASAYVVYGPRVEMVFAHEEVRLYLLQEYRFEFVRTLQLSEKGKINAPGGTQKYWPKHHKKLIESLFDEGYRLRYSGGMVPDLHQILLKGGGLFSYPATDDNPKGKLRKVFEVAPFAYIFEKAGGMAIDGTTRLLDLPLASLHDTTPCFFGSSYEIKRVEEAYGKGR